MTWVGWRLQRTETLIAAAVLALLAALLVPTGLIMASAYNHDRLSACVAVGNLDTSNCGQALSAFTQRFEQLGGLFAWFNLVPGLIGVLLAAPLIFELENGTYRLAWTQSITRGRWLASKLGITVATALLAATVMTVLVTWWRTPLDHLTGRLNTNVFDFEGTVVLGYTLFALGLTLVIGVIWRRTVPALVVGFVGYVVARLFVQGWLRQRYETPLSSTTTATRAGPNLNTAWVLVQEPSDKYGHPPSGVANILQSCSNAIGPQTRSISQACLARHGGGFNHAIYQPASRFWLFQGIETALFGGTALALIAFAAWWMHERTS